MVLSREWLSEFTNIEASDKELCDALTMSGSKVEGFEIIGEEIKNVVVGKVMKMVRHENSDHMFICQVDVGESELVQIVTGAQNVNEGDLVPVAKDDSYLPGGIHIKAGKLRGETSCGMLCSLKELGLTIHDFPYAIEDGIFIIEEECNVGDDIKTVCGLGDTVLEFEITNNRADCLSVIGLARESAATFNTELTLHTPVVKGGGGDIKEFLDVEIIDKDLCPRYTAKMVKDIKIAPSPLWLRKRLRDNGVRPINNIVDITNYVMLEYGQPMHAFDYACVNDNKIVVRKAKEGETLVTLDEKERAITENMLVIADKERPIGLAGVMGGGNSEITDATNMIVFESANFNGTSIRKTAIALGMRTDASSRFEKGLDILGTIPAVERACELVEMLGAGTVLDGIIDVQSREYVPAKVELDVEKINNLLGTDLDRDYMVKVLEKLDFTMDGNTIIAPSFRQDIAHYADIAEEVARFYGYNTLDNTVFKGTTLKGGYSDVQNFTRSISAHCRSMGYYEIMTYSFGSKSAWDKIRLPEDSALRNAFVIQNPLGEDTSVMRTIALPSMLDILSTNFKKRNMDVMLFDLPKIYLKEEGNELADERIRLTMGAYGSTCNFYSFKGQIEALLKSLRMGEVSYVPVNDNPSFHPGRCAKIMKGDVELGVMGEIHPLVADNYGITVKTYATELYVEALMGNTMDAPSYVPLPRFPAMSRDIAVVCDKKINVADLIATMKEAGGEFLESCKLFDVYEGTGIKEGARSCAFNLQMRAKDQTLTDEHADEIMKAVLQKLGQVHNAIMR